MTDQLLTPFLIHHSLVRHGVNVLVACKCLIFQESATDRLTQAIPRSPPFHCHLACLSLFCPAVVLLPWHLTSSSLPLWNSCSNRPNATRTRIFVQASIMSRFVFFRPLHLKFLLSIPNSVYFSTFFVLNSQFSPLPLYQATQLLLILPISKTDPMQRT